MVQLRLMLGKMSKRPSGGNAKSGSVRSSQGSTWWEQRHKRCEDRDRELEEERSGLGEWSHQTHRTISGASGYKEFDERDEELERFVDW